MYDWVTLLYSRNWFSANQLYFNLKKKKKKKEGPERQDGNQKKNGIKEAKGRKVSYL